MGTDSDRAQTLTTAGELLLFVALGLAPLLAGTVHTGTTVLVFLCCAIALMVRTAGVARDQRWRLPPLVLVLVAVFGWVVISILPLPLALLQAISPVLGDLMDNRTVEGIASPRLTFTPGATAWEIVKLAGALAALWLSSQIAASEDGGRRVGGAVAVVAVIVLLTSVAQTLTRTDQVLWMYRPVSVATLGATSPLGFRTPFINPNHAAQFFELAGLCCLAFASLERERWRGLWFVVGLLCVAGVFASGSSAGLACTGFGLLFVLTLWIAARTPTLRLIRFAVPVVLVLAGIGGIGLTVHAAFSGGSVPLSFMDDERAASKTEIWPGAVRLVHEHAWTGVGRGALRDAVPRVQEPGSTWSRSFVENEYLQLPAELGLPVAALLLMGFALTWLVALIRFRGEPRVAAALCGTLVVGAHAFAGFGLEFAGVGLPFMVLMGVCAAHAGLLPVGRWLGGALVLVLVVGLPFAPLAILHGNHFRATSEIGRAEMDADPTDVVESHVRWRPVSPDVSLALAGYFDRRGDPQNTLLWLSRSMVLAPSEAQPHVMAARTLVALGAREQALIEVEAAVGLVGPTSVDRRAVYALLTDLAWTPTEARSALRNDPDLAVDFAEYLLARDGRDPLGRDLVADLEADGIERAALSRSQAQIALANGDLEHAVARLRHALILEPGEVRSVRMLARCLAHLGELDEAREHIAEGIAAHPDDPWFLMAAARVEMTAGELGVARRYLREAVAATPRDRRRILAHAYGLEGELHRAAGRPLDARDSFQRALRMDPSRHTIRIQLAEALAEMGQLEGALREYRRVQERSGAYARLDVRIEALEGQLGREEPAALAPTSLEQHGTDEPLDERPSEEENKRGSEVAEP